jgi:hypothetical protein
MLFLEKDKPIKKLKKSILKNWKVFVLMLVIASSVLFVTIFSVLRPNPGIASVPGLPTSGPLQPFGGWIVSTVDCSSYQSCLPPNPAFALCAIIRCVFQMPFIMHVFNNYYKPPIDAFDVLREDVAEPNEMQQCAPLCDYFYPPPVTGSPPSGQARCLWWCNTVLTGLQEGNVSPAGLGVKGLEEAAEKAGAKSPGMVIIFSPVQGKDPCKNQGYILGHGFGMGLYVTTPSQQVGDSCRGSYYSIGR